MVEIIILALLVIFLAPTPITQINTNLNNQMDSEQVNSTQTQR